MGVKKLISEAYAVYTLGLQAIQSRHPFGTNIYEEEWELAIILDACRVDALREVAPEYEFLGQIDSRWSVGSTSKEWLDNTFTDRVADEVQRTAHISANPFTNQLSERPIDAIEFPQTADTWVRGTGVQHRIVRDTTLLRDDFRHFDPVWEYDPDDDRQFATPQPDEVTRRTIWSGRHVDADRTVVHYMQPHAPYFANVKGADDMGPHQANPFEALKDGCETDRIWSEYLDNLRYVLDSISVLLKNFDAEQVLITADHGEMFGEWGITGHTAGVPHPAVRKVPWAATTATDTGRIDGEQPSKDESVDGNVQQQLKELGYL